MVTGGPTFVDALLAAPAGVALLARLEAEHRPDAAWFDSPPDSDSGAVARAGAAVDALSFGGLVALAVDAAERLAGPWSPGAPDSLAAAYLHAEARRPMAEAVAQRFGARLHAAVNLECQQWWQSDHPREGFFDRALFRDFNHVYGNGEFTFAGLWTVTDPPADAHDALVGAWEVYPGPVSRWRLPVRRGARVWEIHQPADWTRLVHVYPKPASRPHAGWELPGPNQDQEELAELLAVPDHHAARAQTGSHVLPDWAAVAADYDGVHLSWAGFLTTEGYVSDLAGGTDPAGATMLRYWGSERTLWLADVFGEPAPLDAATLSGAICSAVGVDVRTDDARRAQDLDVLTGLLCR